jgi:hypothetical protein
MNYKKMLRQMLDGSRKIDLMREEIKSVIGIYSSLYFFCDKIEKNNYLPIADYKNLKWRIQNFSGNLSLVCIGTLDTIHVDSRNLQQSIKSSWIKEIFESLPTLVEGIQTRYGNINPNVMETLIDASKVKF